MKQSSQRNERMMFNVDLINRNEADPIWQEVIQNQKKYKTRGKTSN